MAKHELVILGIETSCDDTSAGVVQGSSKILSNSISSQVKIHSEFGGVVPELASRSHLENIYIVIEEALKQAALKLEAIDGIAVTYGPGLVGSLLVGIEVAKSLSYVYKKPLLKVNHLEGHIFSSLFMEKNIKFPFIALIVSGGHTELVKVSAFGRYSIIGQTRDDAVGEVFDKVAKLLELGYPGGPEVEKLAARASFEIKFPEAVMKDGSFDFSFSGLKTAVRNYKHNNLDIDNNSLCSGFQQAVIAALLNKTFKVALKNNIKRLVLGGGVIANKTICEAFVKKAKKEGLDLFIPTGKLCTDNGAMIALAGYHKYLKKQFCELDLNADPGLTL